MSTRDICYDYSQKGHFSNGYQPDIHSSGECDSPFSPGILDENKVFTFQSMESTPRLLTEGSVNRSSFSSNSNSNTNPKDKKSHDHDDFLNNINDNDHDKSALESARLVDLDGLSLDGDSDWLTKHKNDKACPNNTLNWLLKDDLDTKPLQSMKDSKYTSINRSSTTLHKSPLMRRDDGSKLDQSTDYGTITQIIGVPPLSTSNKDLSTIGKELSVAKQQKNNLQQQMVDILSPHNANHEFAKLNSNNSTSNGNLLFGSGYILADVNDVQNVAKLQEQSLRMSFSTPLVNGSMGMALNKSSSKLDAIVNVGDEDVHSDTTRLTSTNRTKQPSKSVSTSSGQLNSVNPRGRLSMSKPQQGTMNTSTLARSSGLKKPTKTDCQSVPNIPYNSNHQPTKRTIVNSSSADAHQQSLPNLTRNLPLSLVRTGSRLSTNTRTTPRSSLLIQPGPPTRTASQPTVNTSQAKPNQKSLSMQTTSSQVMTRNMSRTPASQVRNQPSTTTNSRTSTTLGIANKGGRPSLAGTKQSNNPPRSTTTSRQLPNPMQGKATSVIGVTGGRVSNIGLNMSTRTIRMNTTGSNNNKPITLSNVTSRTTPSSTVASRNQIPSGNNISRVGPMANTTSRINPAPSTTSRLNTTLRNNTTNRTMPSTTGGPLRAVHQTTNHQTSAPPIMRSTIQQPTTNKTLKPVTSLRSNTPLNPLTKKTNLTLNKSSPMKPSALVSPLASNIGGGRGPGGVGLMRNIDSMPTNCHEKDEEWKEGCF